MIRKRKTSAVGFSIQMPRNMLANANLTSTVYNVPHVQIQTGESRFKMCMFNPSRKHNPGQCSGGDSMYRKGHRTRLSGKCSKMSKEDTKQCLELKLDRPGFGTH